MFDLVKMEIFHLLGPTVQHFKNLKHLALIMCSFFPRNLTQVFDNIQFSKKKGEWWKCTVQFAVQRMRAHVVIVFGRWLGGLGG